MTQYTYQELREALTKASEECYGIHISGSIFPDWEYSELDELQAILDYLPEKPTEGQEGDRARSDAWIAVLDHPFFKKERWGSKPILEAVLEKLDELHREPLPTEYGSVIKNVKVNPPYSKPREHDYMQLTNIGWFGVDKGDGVLQDAQPEHITSWEPNDTE